MSPYPTSSARNDLRESSMVNALGFNWGLDSRRLNIRMGGGHSRERQASGGSFRISLWLGIAEAGRNRISFNAKQVPIRKNVK